MDIKELFEEIYNERITENDVIIEITKGYNDTCYILNDEFDFWYDEGENISLSFFYKRYSDQYEYEIISKEQYEKDKEFREKQEKIRKLKKQLKELEG